MSLLGGNLGARLPRASALGYLVPPPTAASVSELWVAAYGGCVIAGEHVAPRTARFAVPEGTLVKVRS